MRLKELIKGVEAQELLDFVDVPVKGIAYDSRKVSPGSVFVCIRGVHEDGHKFVSDALKRGAVAIICERATNVEKLPQIVVKDSRRTLSHISAVFYQHPSTKMHIMGITGTNGKTSTCYLCEAIMTHRNETCGIIGTINYRWGDRIVPAGKTTPESLDTQQMLKEMYEAGCKYVFMEVSSHALDQHRVDDVEFQIGIFTNLSLDHLDYHKTFEDYLGAKKKLFENLGEEATAIVNIDDPRSSEIIKCSPKHSMTYGIEKKADVTATEMSLGSNGISFVAQVPEGKVDVKSKLFGKGNVYNILAAISFGINNQVGLEDISAAIGKVKNIKGRFQVVDWGGDFSVVIDYAHTPQALEILLECARTISGGRLITVFGCGGDRDKGKRPIMGKISAEKSDFSFITTDNPRSEDPAQIAAEVESAFLESGKKNYRVVLHRKDAIREAIGSARKGDMVILAGKGHETYQVFKDTVVPFNDYELAKEALQER